MLVLTRSCRESILVGDDVKITVIAVAGDHVKLGVAAPREVRVDRLEVRDRIRAKLRRRAGDDPDPTL